MTEARAFAHRLRGAGRRRISCVDRRATAMARRLQLDSRMANRLITCPETAHIEKIELDETPCGMLILGCSRFPTPCSLACPRTCAARFDRRDRELESEDTQDAIDPRMLGIGDEMCLDVLGMLRAFG